MATKSKAGFYGILGLITLAAAGAWLFFLNSRKSLQAEQTREATEAQASRERGNSAEGEATRARRRARMDRDEEIRKRASGDQSSPAEKPLPTPVAESSSKPLDPWSLAPVKLEALLLVAPFSQDGQFTREGFRIQSISQEHLRLAMPRTLGLIQRGAAEEYIQQTCALAPNNNPIETSQTLPLLWESFRPTHLLTGRFREEGGQWVADLTLRHRDGVLKGTVRSGIGNDLEMAARVGAWLAENPAGMPIDSKMKETIGRPPLGPTLLSTTSKEFAALTADAKSPAWDAIAKDNPVARNLRIFYAGQQDELTLLAQHTPGPLPEDASIADHEARRLAGTATENRAMLLHELELLLAKYPGDFESAIVWFNSTMRTGEHRERYLKSATEWEARTGHHPYARALLGVAHKQSAWDWRGSGFISEVSPEGLRNFEKHIAKATSLLEEARGQGLEDPSTGDQLLRVLGATGQSDQAHGLFRAIIHRFPDFRDAWVGLLQYQRPRWGGTESRCVALIDEAMRSRPKNARFGYLAQYYHFHEAALGMSNSGEYPSLMREYVKRNAEAKRQLEEGFERLIGPDSSLDTAAEALDVAASLRNSQLGYRLLDKYPDIYKNIAPATQGNSFVFPCGVTMHVLYHWYINTKRFTQARAIADLSEKHDPRMRAGGLSTEMDVIFWDQKQALVNIAAAKVLTGGGEKDLTTLSAFADDPKMVPMILIARYFSGNATKSDLDLIEKAKRGGEPHDPDLYYLEALLKKKFGSEADARASYAVARSKRNTPGFSVRKLLIDETRTVFGEE